MSELNGIFYEKAIEARAKINVLPNLHILVGKSELDNYYKGLCLDTGIICISNSIKLDDDTLNYIFEVSCMMALKQFYTTSKIGEENFILAGRVSERRYWEKYDELINIVKKESISKLFKSFSSFEETVEHYTKKIKNKYKPAYKELSQIEIASMMFLLDLIIKQEDRNSIASLYQLVA